MHRYTRKAFLRIFFIVLILLFGYFVLNEIHVYIHRQLDAEEMSFYTRRNKTVFDIMRIFDYHTCRNDKLDLHNMSVSNATTKQVNAIVEYECSHLMSLKAFKGGLGNIMFQAASVIGVAAIHGYTPVFPYDSVLFDVFDIAQEIDFKLENTKNLEERVCCQFNSKVSDLSHYRNWTLSGYLQSWKYFEGAEDKVRKAFTFKDKYTNKAREYLENISKTGYINIGVHIRRGDFLSEEHQKLGYVVAPVSYIQKTMIYFFEKFKYVQFIFTSDDLVWCKAHFNFTSVYFTPFKDFATDMALLTLCDHIIITGGTFGWWSGWLSKGITVYYQGFPKKGSKLALKFDESRNFEDYYPRDWIGME